MSEQIPARRRLGVLKTVELSLTAILIVLLAAYFIQFHLRNRREIPVVDLNDVVVSTVRTEILYESVAVEATVQPLQTVYLDAREGGRVDKIHVEVGSIVREADPILFLDNPGLAMEILSREAEVLQQSNAVRNNSLALDQYKIQLSQQLSELDNQLQQQEKLYERYKELDKDSLISKHEFEKARDQYEYLSKRKDLMEKSQKSDLALRTGQLRDLEEALARTNVSLEAARKRLEDLTVTAPVAGQITSLSAEIGQTKTSGQRLGQIDSFSGFKATAVIEERHIGRIEVNKAGSFEIDGRRYDLNVKKIFPEVKSGTFEAELEFRGERPKTIRRGQTLHVRLDLGEVPDVLQMDPGEFLASTEGAWVFRIDPDSKAAVRAPVKLGRRSADGIEILKGLQEGDRVIVSSYDAFAKADRIALKFP